MQQFKKVWTYFIIAAVAMGAALSYQLFVFPNQFAPSGLNGICTMIQKVTGVNLGYLSLLINVPLATLVFFKVSKPLAVRSMIYVVVFSLGLLILDKVDLSPIAYSTENGTSRIMGPLTAGILMGFVYSVLTKASAYTGGTDFISALIHAKHPEKNVFGLTFAMNAIVAIGSYFVYGFKIEPVLMCLVYSFASTNVADRAVKTGRSAVLFEIVTDQPEAISNEIIHRFHHGATVVPAKGAYTGKDTYVVKCVVNPAQVAKLSEIVSSYPNTFATMSQVNQVMGNFRKISLEGKEVVTILDSGDGKTV